MQWLASIFVGRPLNILLVGAVFLLGHLALRAAGRTGSRGLLVLAAAWGIYGAWEWLVKVRTPEADIRVDLLVIWPVLAILTAWYTFKGLR